jgi:CRISPR-associated protein Csx14
MSTVLLATLGSEPQIIPLTVQLLAQRKRAPQRVCVLHTTADRSPVREAVARLRAIFAAPPAQQSWGTTAAPVLELLPVAIPDVLTPTQLDAFGVALYRALRDAIAQGARVHLLLAGGRKSMTMVGMTIAQMLLGPEDCVWYLHSREELRQSGQAWLDDHSAHPAQTNSAGAAQLVQIPLPRQSAAPPVYTRPFHANTPAGARELLAEDQQRRIAYFWERELTAAERAAAQLAAQELLTVQAVAARLHKSPKTTTNQLNAVYSKMESYFGLQPQAGLKREFLRYLLAEYENRRPPAPV